jgi:4-hydroxy-3-methylbut-2-enyl diphosphate reductase
MQGYFVSHSQEPQAMHVIRADAMGLCFGVRDALALTRTVENASLVAIHGELVHNEIVQNQLKQQGFHITPEANRKSLPERSQVLITAHGISERERLRLEAAGKRLIDTTCPLVRLVHEAARRLAADGFHVIIIGRLGHVEVQGIAEDLADHEIVGRVDEVQTWPHARLGIVCQTTTPPWLAEQIRIAIELQNPHAEIRFQNTICQPTRERQDAVERLCGQVDAVVVVGGANSNNTRQLVALCERLGTPAYHVQRAADIRPSWFEGCKILGLTAGTSTLDETIQAVYDRLISLPEIA